LYHFISFIVRILLLFRIKSLYRLKHTKYGICLFAETIKMGIW